MKFLKWFLIVVIVLLAALFLIGFLLPSKVHVERSLVMAVPPEKVFAKVNDLRTWSNWSPWNLRDPNMQVSYEGPDSGVGQKSIWKSETQGNGSQEITAIDPNQRIETFLDFGSQGTAVSSWKFSPEGDGTQVVWDMDVELKSPLERYFGLMMESMIGPDYEEGLANLKRLVEGEPVAPTETPETVNPVPTPTSP